MDGGLPISVMPPAPSRAASVAVVIPHRNDVARLWRCLLALMPQADAATEVVVVDNASTNPLDGVRAAHPGLSIVVEPQAGAAHARNAGVAATVAPIVLFLDCDCVPAPDWLARARASLERADLVGGRVDVFDEAEPGSPEASETGPGERRGNRTGAQAFEAIFAFNNRAYVETKGFSVTANLATRRDVLQAVGGFRDGVSEDLDWCRRATALGFRLAYDDAMRVAHPSRGDWPALRRKWERLTREGFGLERSRLRWGLRALAMPPSALVHAPRALRHASLPRRDRLAAVGMLLRLRTARAGWMLRQALTGRP